MVGGEPLFLCFLMPLIERRLGQKSYYQEKVYFHAKVRGFRDSTAVLRDSIQKN